MTRSRAVYAAHTEIVPGIGFAAPLGEPDAVLAQVAREIEVSDEIVDEGNGRVATPRLTGWYGDPGTYYTYSGLTRIPQPWKPALAALRDNLNAELGIALNSCLVGVYEDGSNSLDWHSDDEAELRDRIVSVSLGSARTFLLREIPAGQALPVLLTHGSVLVMSVESQQRWQHAIPAEPAAGRRVNLTFRVIAGASHMPTRQDAPDAGRKEPARPLDP